MLAQWASRVPTGPISRIGQGVLEEAVFSEAVAVFSLEFAESTLEDELWDDVVDRGVFPPGFGDFF